MGRSGGERLAQTGATERPSGCGSDGMSGGWDLPPDRRIFCAAATAADLLHPAKIDLLRDDETPPTLRWRAEFNRTA